LTCNSHTHIHTHKHTHIHTLSHTHTGKEGTSTSVLNGACRRMCTDHSGGHAGKRKMFSPSCCSAIAWILLQSLSSNQTRVLADTGGVSPRVNLHLHPERPTLKPNPNPEPRTINAQRLSPNAQRPKLKAKSNAERQNETQKARLASVEAGSARP
jgi:hypothetical protein